MTLGFNTLKTFTLLAALAGLLVFVGGLLGGRGGMVMALVFAVAMNGFVYWKSDSLMFIGKKGMVRGWQQTLDNYKKGYPDTAAMGKLSFDIVEVKPLSKEYAFVVGKWMLKRSIGDVSGHYTLLLRRIKGQWKIVADHSS